MTIQRSLKLTQEQVRYYLKQGQQPTSLNMRVGDEQDIELSDLLENNGELPEDLTTQFCLSTDLESLMAHLTSQQREVLTLRFGLADGQPLTLSKISKRLNFSRERVRQIENQALKQLHQYPKVAEKLIDYCQ